MTPHRPVFAFALALTLALFLTAHAQADLWIDDTLELRVAEAEIVARGTLETFASMPLPNELRRHDVAGRLPAIFGEVFRGLDRVVRQKVIQSKAAVTTDRT